MCGGRCGLLGGLYSCQMQCFSFFLFFFFLSLPPFCPIKPLVSRTVCSMGDGESAAATSFNKSSTAPGYSRSNSSRNRIGCNLEVFIISQLDTRTVGCYG
jgi:hypothetical protein